MNSMHAGLLVQGWAQKAKLRVDKAPTNFE